mmetsp:Transcript_71366/g.186081  ORF Transcript_71366/g.186081 Transcript_71366/m.186081 type:complete len:254 (-) Transcript_71366:260-1021(-)
MSALVTAPETVEETGLLSSEESRVRAPGPYPRALKLSSGALFTALLIAVAVHARPFLSRQARAAQPASGLVGLQAEGWTCQGSKVTLATSAGYITITLCPMAAPTTVQKIEQLVQAGTYNDAAFYRAEPGFVIQGGFQFPGCTQSSGETFPLEYMLPNKRGTVAMARTEDPQSGSGEFFINLQDSPNLDQAPGVDPSSPEAAYDAGFTVFGQVDEASLQVAEQIAAMPTTAEGTLHMLNTPVAFGSATVAAAA